MKNYFMIKILSVLCIVLWGPIASASVLEIRSSDSTVLPATPFGVQIVLNTEGKSINTIEGDLHYDATILQVERIMTGDSFISLWVEKPENKTAGVIHFSGIVPGGVNTPQGPLFSVTFLGLRVGQAELRIENPLLLLNTGEGVPDKASRATLMLTISTTGDTHIQTQVHDTIPPEKFTIERTRSEYVHDNKFFVVFNATDKGSGIGYYEVCEFSLLNCSESTSPTILHNQTPFYRIIVRAYDMDGNMRQVSTTSPLVIATFCFLIVLLGYIRYRYIQRDTV